MKKNSGAHEPSERGGIVLAGTPIGNLEDASPRLRRELAEADVVAAEDTRHLNHLLSGLGLTLQGRAVAYHEHNEADRATELVEAAQRGERVVVVSDAGMPTVSDPGFRVVEAAAASEVPVSVVPGPSAALTALAGSGLPSDRFTFEGFLPRKPGERNQRLKQLDGEERTMLFYEAPHRIEATLEALAAAFGNDRPAVLARELTKLFEQFRRGDLGSLLDGVREEAPRGEIVLVVSGAEPPAAADPAQLVDRVEALVSSGIRLKDACQQVATDTGASKRELYQAVLESRS